MDYAKLSVILLVILLIIGAIIGVGIYRALSPETSPEGQIERKDSVYNSNRYFLEATSPVVFPKIYTLGALAEEIIWCESRGKHDVCNQEFGCGAGMGLFQLIPSTVKYCEEKLGKTIDPFCPEDNYECGMWLLENEGTRHWGYEGANWGSYECWSKRI